MVPRPRRILALAAGLAALTAAGSLVTPPFESAPPGDAPSLELWASPAVRAAADAVRAGDCAGARAQLATRVPPGAEGPQARELLGLWDHACGDFRGALRWLQTVLEEPSALADWRLWALAESSAGVGRQAHAAAAWAELLRRHPRSPLRSPALLRAATLAADRGDFFRALTYARRALHESVDPAIAGALSALEWRIAGEQGNAALARATAHRMLIEHPILASQLSVVETFRRPDGGIDWQRLFSADELLRRARNLLDAEIENGALDALAAVAEGERGFEWRLLRAEALTRDRRGAEAWRLLEPMVAASPRDEARLEWRRAVAALDAALARRNRRNLPSAERKAMADRGRAHLRRVADLDAEPDLTLAALRSLVARLPEDRPEDVLAAVRELRRHDPADSAGAERLFRLGWDAFSDRGLEASLASWQALVELYPDTPWARSGLYWSGRAQERLGNLAGARALYGRVAGAPFSDFYKRHALRRLGQPADAPAAAPAPEAWPRDPLLARARLLTDAGLDAAARIELDALGDAAAPRARYALESLILARTGQRRDSIQAVRGAFPALGTAFQDRVPIDALRMYYPLDYFETISRHARSQQLPPTLVLAMIRQESAFDPAAHSWAGARGLMQLMPSTGRELGRRFGLRISSPLQLSDPDTSVRLGTAYFRQVLDMFDDEELALAGYNGGPYRIKRLWRRAGRDPEIDAFLEGLYLDETRLYVKRVLLFSDSYRRIYDDAV